MDPTLAKPDLVGTFQRKNFAFKAGKVEDDGTFEGYASVFGNVDSYGDQVDKGAFLDSIKEIKESGDPLPVLWQHRSSEPVGGSDLLEEDDHGLKTRGFLLVNELPQAKAAHVLMKRRIVKGLSIGYFIKDAFYDSETQIYHLKKVKLIEYSVVTFPANTEAVVTEVKSIVRSGQLPNLRDFEAFLREGGFSNAHAKAIAGHGLRKLLVEREADGEKGDPRILDILQNFTL
jgi:HK97 family phage prohead protease